MTDVAIIGTGMTKFGEHWEKSIRDLALEAGTKAVADANISGKEMDGMFIGSMSPGLFTSQEHIGALAADVVGVNVPAVRVEGACASGSIALRQGFMAIKSGLHDIVMVGGVEKMTDIPTEQAAVALAGAGDEEWEGYFGATFPALYALMARAHMKKYGTTEEQMASVAVKNHAFAVHNKYAQFPFPINVESVMKSTPIALPLKLLDCSPITDGAACVILTRADLARKYCDSPVYIRGSGQASDTLALHDRKSFTEVYAAQLASRQAYGMAKVTPEDIGVVEVHDCFTIAEIMAIEDLGFFKKGEGGPATEEGETSMGGKVVVNTSGGLKGCGHPVGATGIKQAIEITLQLRGEAKGRNTGAEWGMTHNVGGSGATCVCHIFHR